MSTDPSENWTPEYRAAFTAEKLRYGKDLDMYKAKYSKYKANLELVKAAHEREDIQKAGFHLEEMEESIELIHMIMLRLNNRLCEIYNTLPG